MSMLVPNAFIHPSQRKLDRFEYGVARYQI